MRAISKDHYCLWPNHFPIITTLGDGGPVSLDGKTINLVKMTGASGYKGQASTDKAHIFSCFGREVELLVGEAAPTDPKAARAARIAELQALLQEQEEEVEEVEEVEEAIEV